MKSKRIMLILLAAVMLLPLSACKKKSAGAAELGPKLSHNVARVYEKTARRSRFVIDGKPVEGEVTGEAFMDPAASGSTALAWVDTTVYFVSEKGIDKLASNVGSAEISFDGRYALYLVGTDLMLYSVETRSSEIVDSAVSAVLQFAFSPGGSSIMFTANYPSSGTERVTKLYKDGKLTTMLEGMNAMVLAVSDDADIIYYFSFRDNSFCVDQNGERYVITRECGAATNYNFTSDLSEATYNTRDTENHWFRLSDKMTADLGQGFQYTLKTDIYSSASVSQPVYINDVTSYTGGFWLKRTRLESLYIYDVGVMNENGAVNWLCKNTKQYALLPDGTGVVWMDNNHVYKTGLDGKAVDYGADVIDFAVSGDSQYVYYLNRGGQLYAVKNPKKPSLIDSKVSDITVAGNNCLYIRNKLDDAGELMRVCGKDPAKLLDGVSGFERRAGHTLIYAEPSVHGDTTLYKIYFTVDGESAEYFAEGVEK